VPVVTRARIGAALAVTVGAGFLGTAGLAKSQPMCGSRELQQAPLQYAHVVWVWLENQSYDTVLTNATRSDAPAPYIDAVAAQCGLATNYHNVTHPSLPNYVAATSGDTQGLTRNCAPSACRMGARSLFGQLESAGLDWASYAEDMPTPCAKRDSDLDTPLVNPAVYYEDAGGGCALRDVPMGDPTGGRLAATLSAGTLPAFSLLIPNLCNDGHNCSVSASDIWLARWLPRLVSSLDYTTGNTMIIITWDEGESSDFAAGEDCTTALSASSCHVPAIVISPYVVPGTTSATALTHYSLLKSTEQLLGLPLLGHAADAEVEGVAAFFHAQFEFAAGGPWQLVKSFGSVAAARVNANVARRSLADDDLSITIRRTGHLCNVRVSGFYTADEAATVRARLTGPLRRAALRLRTAQP
jgi:phosphatidylinositol-3-phosphatase